MKKPVVLSPKNTNQVAASAVDGYKYYGVIVSAGNPLSDRGFITAHEFAHQDRGQFAVRCLNCLTQGNGWGYLGGTDSSKKRTLAECVTSLLGDKCEVFQFNTHRELIAWLNRQPKTTKKIP